LVGVIVCTVNNMLESTIDIFFLRCRQSSFPVVI
jgi:hypothetical protein